MTVKSRKALDVESIATSEKREDYNRNLMRYSIKLAILKQMLSTGTISDEEYTLVKKEIMKEHGIISDLMA